MGAREIIVVFCDGPDVGLVCSITSSTSTDSLTSFRRTLARAGWTRRHHADRQVDLCPKCSPKAVLDPQHVGGRPRKEVVGRS